MHLNIINNQNLKIMKQILNKINNFKFMQYLHLVNIYLLLLNK